MHEQRLAIATFETKDDAEAAGYKLPLTKEQHSKLLSMNRHERRKFAAEERARLSAERAGRKNY